MTLWELAVTTTRGPRPTASAMMRAAAVVLPVPGGPWMGRYEPGLNMVAAAAEASRTLASDVDDDDDDDEEEDLLFSFFPRGVR